jgi:hypothetical protein
MAGTPEQRADALLSSAVRELVASLTIPYREDRDHWTAALQLVRCAQAHITLLKSSDADAAECCEAALPLVVLGKRHYGSEHTQSIEHAKQSIQKALDVLNAER